MYNYTQKYELLLIMISVKVILCWLFYYHSNGEKRNDNYIIHILIHHTYIINFYLQQNYEFTIDIFTQVRYLIMVRSEQLSLLYTILSLAVLEDTKISRKIFFSIIVFQFLIIKLEMFLFLYFIVGFFARCRCQMYTFLYGNPVQSQTFVVKIQNLFFRKLFTIDSLQLFSFLSDLYAFSQFLHFQQTRFHIFTSYDRLVRFFLLILICESSSSTYFQSTSKTAVLATMVLKFHLQI